MLCANNFNIEINNDVYHHEAPSSSYRSRSSHSPHSFSSILLDTDLDEVYFYTFDDHHSYHFLLRTSLFWVFFVDCFSLAIDYINAFSLLFLLGW